MWMPITMPHRGLAEPDRKFEVEVAEGVSDWRDGLPACGVHVGEHARPIAGGKAERAAEEPLISAAGEPDLIVFHRDEDVAITGGNGGLADLEGVTGGLFIFGEAEFGDGAYLAGWVFGATDRGAKIHEGLRVIRGAFRANKLSGENA